MSAIPAQIGRAARIMVLPYWLTLCVVTHWPGMRMADPGVPYAPLDKFCHAVGYGGLAALLLVIMRGRMTLARSVAAVVVVLAVYGVLDELTQPWFNRTIDAWDLAANAVGVAGGLVLVCAALRYQRGSPRSLNAGFKEHPPKHEGRHERFIRHSVVVSALTFVSRLLGLVRDAVLGAVFGKGVVLDAFFIGFMVPNLFRRLFGEGALTAAFLPRYRRLMDDDPELAKRYASAVIVGVSLLLSALVLLGELLLLSLWASVDVSKWSLALRLTAIMLPYAPMVCAVAFLGTVLQARGRFAPAALAPIELNLGMIAVAALAAWWSDDKVTMAVTQAVGVLACGGLQLAVLGRYLAGTGVLTRSFGGLRGVGGVGEQVKATLRTMLPMLLGLGVFQVNTLLDGLIAYGLSSPPGQDDATFTLMGQTLEYPLHTGAVTTLTFAQRLYQFPLGVFGIAIATAIFPAMSALGRDHQREAFGSLVRRGLRLTLFIALPASVGLVLTAEPLTRVIFEHGQFTTQDAHRVAAVLVGYAAGVWAYSMTHVLTRAFYARDDAATPLKVSLAMVLLNVCLNLTLIWPMGAAGLATATATSAVVQVCVLTWLLRRHVDRPWDGDAARGAGRAVLATLAMTASLLFVRYHIDPGLLHWIGAFALTVVMVVIGTVVYTATTLLLRCEEIGWLRRG